MLLVTHLAAGAALGEAVSGLPGAPVIAFALGLASHYVLDALPHWEKITGEKFPNFETSGSLRKWPRSSFNNAFGDVIVTLLLLIYVVWRDPHGPFYVNPVFWGALGGTLPDILTNTPFLSGVWSKWPIFKQERYIHKYFHITHDSQLHMPKYLGLVAQIVVIIFSALIILNLV